MGVWAKLDGLKRQASGQGFAMDYETIKWELQKPNAQKALGGLGLSKGGIAEISQGAPISKSDDRKIVSAILAIVADGVR